MVWDMQGAFRLFMVFHLLLWLPKAAAEADTVGLVFMYNDHAPYIVSSERGLRGFLVDYVRAVSAEADVPVRWHNVPWLDQLPTLERNAKNLCAVTLFKTPEREKFLRYTAPVGSSGRFVLVGVKNNRDLLGHNALADVVADENLRPVLQPNTVYSTYINGLLAGKNHRRQNASIDRIARSLLASPQDYFILSEVRARALMGDRNKSAQLAMYSHYHDLAKETFHYIGCSKATDSALFDRLNAAIERRGPMAAH